MNIWQERSSVERARARRGADVSALGALGGRACLERVYA
jgi:hypothetical protein